MFHGVLTALITPFDDDNRIDWEQLERIVEFQIKAGVNGLVPIGTTGECPTLSGEETKALIAATVKFAHGRVPVIAGAGSNCTSTAIRKAAEARELGVDATMQIVPYYNKPTQEGLVDHFTAIADAVDTPLMVYNVPARTGISIDVSTALSLAGHPRIVALKDAGGDITRSAAFLSLRPPGFSVLTGEDGLTFPMLSIGSDGVVSVVSNVYPEYMVRMVALCKERRWDQALHLHYKLLPFVEVLFEVTNPIPIKAAMAMRFGTGENYRLPLRAVEPELRSRIRSAMDDLAEEIMSWTTTPAGAVE